METLDSENLIKYFRDLQLLCEKWDPIENKISFKTFANNKGTLKGIGPATAIEKLRTNIFDYSEMKHIDITQDFAGLYLFSRNGKPFYCGISRNVIKRILDHQKGPTSSMATLAHRIAKAKATDQQYHQAFDSERNELMTCDVSLIKFYDQNKEEHSKNNMHQHKEEIMLYLFEVFVSVKYNTEHNTFRTH
ncbi:hypothetical protein [Gillisia sp. Hel_I_29]|uniref:hypothetical protein n=1 Tax=Gillisia sp. Hel_I_29 TaxID=1249975 RepID=UPI0005594402|nr:hypothetical protein [Gillisia sp. Hel_I_29]